jgi:hypothetical protein
LFARSSCPSLLWLETTRSPLRRMPSTITSEQKETSLSSEWPSLNYTCGGKREIRSPWQQTCHEIHSTTWASASHHLPLLLQRHSSLTFGSQRQLSFLCM